MNDFPGFEIWCIVCKKMVNRNSVKASHRWGGWYCSNHTTKELQDAQPLRRGKMIKVVEYFGYTVVIAFVIGLLVLRFMNPDMTSIRFIIEFWKEYVAWFVGFFCGIFLIVWASD